MDEEMKKPESIQDVLNIIAPARTAFAAHWQGLSEEEMIRRPGPQEDWSIKDLIAHIAWWETYMIDVLTLLAAGATLPIIKDFDAVNARVFAQHSDLPLDFVLGNFERNWVHMQAFLNSITISDLTNDKGRGFGWIRGDTFGHYEEHQPDLLRYIASLKA